VRVLRFEAITHNTRQLGCGRAPDRLPQIVARLAGTCQRFCTALDCVDIGFIPGSGARSPRPGPAARCTHLVTPGRRRARQNQPAVRLRRQLAEIGDWLSGR
jgi:hypothetical protein